MARIGDILYNGVDMEYPAADNKARARVDKAYKDAARRGKFGTRKLCFYESYEKPIEGIGR